MKVFASVIACIMLFAFSVPVDDIRLQYEFKVGDQYTWAQQTQQTVNQNVGGMEQKSENDFQNEFIMKVVEVNANGARIETAFTKIKIDTKTPIMNNVMDSQGPDDKVENQVLKSMLNKPFHVFITKTGNIEKIEGADNLWSDFAKVEIEPVKRKAVQEALNLLLGEESLKANFQAAFITYPDKKVKAGEQWQVRNEMNVSFPLAIENTWSVQSFNSSEAKLMADGTFTTTDKTKLINLPGGLKARSDLNGQQAIKCTVNARTGWPSKQDLTAEIKGTMTLLAGSIVPQDMDIPTEILSKTSYTFSKK